MPITVGVTRPDLLGTLSVGFLLDDQFAQQLKQLTGSDVAFGMDGKVLSSTLPRDERPALSPLLARTVRSSPSCPHRWRQAKRARSAVCRSR